MAGTIYEVSTLGASDNQIVFNNQGSIPYYRLKARMPQRREIREFDIDLPESMGIADFEMFIGKTYYTLAGIMYPQDMATYHSGRAALRKLASLTIEQADANANLGYVPYAWTESTLNGDVAKHINLKVIYTDLPESTKNGLKQPFQLYCKIKYPAIFGDAQSFTIGSNVGTTSGSSGLPMGFPAGLGATTYSSTGSTNNPGDLSAWANFTIYGPVTNPKITNTTTGQSMTVNVNLPTSADSISINWSSDSNTITQGGNSILNKLTSDSQWITLQPGNNNLTYTGSSMGSGTYVNVSYNPQWPLS